MMTTVFPSSRSTFSSALRIHDSPSHTALDRGIELASARSPSPGELTVVALRHDRRLHLDGLDVNRCDPSARCALADAAHHPGQADLAAPLALAANVDLGRAGRALHREMCEPFLDILWEHEGPIVGLTDEAPGHHLMEQGGQSIEATLGVVDHLEATDLPLVSCIPGTRAGCDINHLSSLLGVLGSTRRPHSASRQPDGRVIHPHPLDSGRVPSTR